MFRDRFTPRSYARYADSLARELATAYRSNFIRSEDLRFRTEIGAVELIGTAECEGGIQVEIQERLQYVRPRWLLPPDPVELVFYRYNAVLVNRGTIFRYNSPHKDHRQFHHVHRFDVLGTGAETVTAIRERDVPTIRQVFQEVEDWYNLHILGK